MRRPVAKQHEVAKRGVTKNAAITSCAVGLKGRQLFAEETIVRWREPSRLPATATVRPRDDLQQVAARVLKIDAASAVVTVDLTCLGLRGVGPMR